MNNEKEKGFKFIGLKDEKGKEVLKKFKEDILTNPKMRAILNRLKDK